MRAKRCSSIWWLKRFAVALLLSALIATPATETAAQSAEVLQAQIELQARGYDPGPLDGFMGRRTRRALRQFQEDIGRPVTGLLDEATLETLTAPEPEPEPEPQAEPALPLTPVPGLSDLILWAGACAIAGMLFLVFVFVRRARRARQITPKWVVVDGSNVMYWKENTPQIDTVREVLDRLSASGFTPGIMFDANAGYLLTGRYEHDGVFEKLLGLPRDHVMVVDKGTPADISILAAARDLGARIVTNDRFREWAETHPEVHSPGYLIRGEYRAGKLWLDLGKGG